MPCVYILKSQKSEKYYVGSSRENDAKTRVEAHNSGKIRSTKYGKPWKLINEEYFNSYTIARKRELFLKSGKGRGIIKERWPSG
ncbi:MAG TPA: endonuclease, partial [Elusimicrobia bacterium]|nr:endonuclease [Elusimicrobiota bacterium]